MPPTDAPPPTWQVVRARQTALVPRGLTVSRTLPHRDRRMVGPWCFLDRFGPLPMTDGAAMAVAPHPHTGLQTVTWLLGGEVTHRDSLGSQQTIRPGQLNLMTAGAGIAHAEHSAPTGVLDGVQLWVALPEDSRAVAPAFAHHADLPVGEDRAARITVLAGALAGLVSPARVYSPLLAAQVELSADGRALLPLDPDFEHAVLALAGQASTDGRELPDGDLVYLGSGRRALSLRAEASATLLVLGGEPSTSEFVLWWNFLGRDHDEVAAARERWESGGFAPVADVGQPPLPAPPMPTTRLRPRGRVR